ncbi:UDP-N-acetylenolpyruvoylglucosamine reductase [Geothermobacter hydrogeniphilus]|uniref:UDP-N-acetylenolpyruvoylglucosamine reductase n=1 Tax=Geothermobacter hydrogeniphilus TaxID=1969733 RepID=A0A2K2H9T0_9BACT|nr:UDP-N-acetylmuramate dehydrogenase [Geothermobacter hydrogeniphilus]PNU20066.1 UDP-N-acetylenolpyruvoylglucosamine reductase [Geothermobacter hydrogeniphilus]
MKNGLQQLFDNLSKSGGVLRRHEPLSRWTSWRVGGPADLFYQPENSEQLLSALEQAVRCGQPWTVIGAGSNLLVRDGGIRGLVVQTRRLDGLQVGADGRVEAECGLWLPLLVRRCVASGLAGLEELAGIPGTVGGALVTNAGAHGRNIGDCLQQVELFNAGRREIWSAAEVGCVYRGSNIGPGQLVLRVALQLQQGAPTPLRNRVDALLAARRRSQAVGGANAGSVFKNPPGEVAWKLIDAAGLRGLAVGPAQVSPRHANFIVNRGGAGAGQILELIGLVQEKVRTCCGVELETEVKVVGEDNPDRPAEK